MTDLRAFDFGLDLTTEPARSVSLGDFGLGARPMAPEPSISVDPCPTSDADRYSAWADRLRDKRARNQATILGAGPRPVDATTNWSADWVISSDDPVDEPGVVPDQMRRGRLLGELGLEPGASAEAVTLAYRALAKVHHPDRWIDADDGVQRDHAEQMLRFNAVYRALRTDT